jgi:glycosyltransferase involved in cell wall biosynthesis
VKHATFAVPGDLATPTGGYAYDRRAIDELRALGWSIDVLDIGAHFPHPTAAQRADAQQRLAAASPQSSLIVDGLAFGAMPDGAAALAQTHTLIALVHHPLAMEQGLSAEQAAVLRTSERAALAAARGVIATSAFTARILTADYGVPPDKITVAEPGTDRAEWATGSSSDTVHLLTVGSVVPRKGYDTLVAALAKVADLPWQLTIVGDTTRSREFTAQLERMIEQARLGQRIKFTGALDDGALAAAYRFADMFVLASRLEGYGMAAAEAISYGLPLVGTRGGALIDTIGETGLLVPPDDIAALADALRTAISDPDTRLRLRVASRSAAQRLPTWRNTAEKVVRAIEAAG